MFSRAMAAVLGSVLLFAVAGCGKKDVDTLPKAMIQLLEDTTATLKGITDVPTARAAEPKLKELAARKAKLDEEAKALKLSKAELDASDATYAEPIKYAAEKMSTEVMRIATTNPEAAQIVATAMGM